MTSSNRGSCIVSCLLLFPKIGDIFHILLTKVTKTIFLYSQLLPSSTANTRVIQQIRWILQHNEQFPAQVVVDLHRLGRCVRPCIVMMQDDSFRLMTLRLFFLSFLRLFLMFVPCVCSLWNMLHHTHYTVDILQWISTALHPSATKNLITGRCSILVHASLSDLFVY